MSQAEENNHDPFENWSGGTRPRACRHSVSFAEFCPRTRDPCQRRARGGHSRMQHLASKYPEYTWGDVEIQVYRECMAEHHQVE